MIAWLTVGAFSAVATVVPLDAAVDVQLVIGIAVRATIGLVLAVLTVFLINLLRAPGLLDAECQTALAAERARVEAAKPRRGVLSEMGQRMYDDSRARSLAQEPARAMERARFRQRVEALRRRLIVVMQVCEEASRGERTAESARAEVGQLSIERADFGAEMLGDDLDDLLRRVVAGFDAFQSATSREEREAALGQMRTAQGEGVAALDKWLRRLTI